MQVIKTADMLAKCERRAAWAPRWRFTVVSSSLLYVTGRMRTCDGSVAFVSAHAPTDGDEAPAKDAAWEINGLREVSVGPWVAFVSQGPQADPHPGR